jgi:predicted nucleotidyltransferase
LDLLGWVEPFGTYEALLPGSELIDVGGIGLRVIGLDDLIAIKQHIRRPKDQVTLLQLEALKRLRDEGKN